MQHHRRIRKQAIRPAVKRIAYNAVPKIAHMDSNLVSSSSENADRAQGMIGILFNHVVDCMRKTSLVLHRKSLPVTGISPYARLQFPTWRSENSLAEAEIGLLHSMFCELSGQGCMTLPVQSHYHHPACILVQ